MAALHEGGVAVGVIVLLGAGGERFDADHVARTADALSAMRLAPEDFVYFSEYVDDRPSATAAAPRTRPDLQPLASPAGARAARGDHAGPAFRRRPAQGRRASRRYDIREFVY